MAEEEFDTLGFLLDLYTINQQQDIQSDSVSAVQEGFEMQNPFAPYQPLFAGGLMNLMSDPSQITQTPGYQFSYDQGLQSMFAKQSATGNRFSGKALTEAMQFGQGLASQMYNTEVDRYAKLAGAYQPISGGVQTGENLSSLYSQGGYNDTYFMHNMFNSQNNPYQAPSVTSQGG